jgi:hypothetical protein
MKLLRKLYSVDQMKDDEVNGAYGKYACRILVET